MGPLLVEVEESSCKERLVVEIQFSFRPGSINSFVDIQWCLYSFKNKENCWFNDGCDQIFVAYDDYICKRDDKKN